jgi:hypothetical protein
MSDDNPTLGDVFEAAFRKTLSGLRTWLPGEIRAYDAVGRRATVQIMAPDGWVDETGARQTSTPPPLTDVPVPPCGSGSTRVKFPIRVGDPCIVLFSSSCLTAYKATGRLLDHGDDRHHHESDAIAIPMPRITGNVEDDAMIEFTDDGLIRAGGDEPLVTRAEFLGHTHATAGAGTPSPPISGPPGSAVTFPGTPKLRG